jgi:signal transduction histidine kinase
MKIFIERFIMGYRKYYFFATLFYLIAVVSHIIYSYLSTKQAMEKQIDILLQNSVYIAPLVLADTFHNRHMMEFPISPYEDMDNILKLSKQAKALKVNYIYTVIQEDDKIVFTSASATDEELATKQNYTRFGDVYDDAPPVIWEVFSSQKPSYAEHKDKRGTFRSFYITRISPDGTRYVVGADIDLNYIEEQLHQNIFNSLRDMFFYISILIPFFLVYRSNMKRIKNDLEDVIKQRTNELEIKQKAMFQQAKMASMGEMIGNIAHQWRQPLTVISATAGSLKFQDELGILQKDALHKGLDGIDKSVHYLSETIDNFRNFFTPNKQKETKNIAELFDMIEIVFGNSLENANIEVIKNIEDFQLNTYINELNQVILNLIKNAKDAIDKEGFIFIDCFVDDKIYIKVKDSGGGIPLDVIDRIYEPYFTTKHESVGTGIGLNMSYQIITEHLKGAIEVKNVEFQYNGELLKGAEFTITLPKELLQEE